jgi:hypothetical protein
MEDASRAFLDAVRKSMRQIRSVIGATTINPMLLTAAERIQFERYLRREQTNAAFLELSKDGLLLNDEAVRSAIASPWSNGQTEEQITRLKLVKRQMYGRGKLDLLQGEADRRGMSVALYLLHQDCVRAKIASRMTAPASRGGWI